MTHKDYELICDKLAPLFHYPTAIAEAADILATTNPRFDRDKFIRRATEKWEERYAQNAPRVDDYIPY